MLREIAYSLLGLVALAYAVEWMLTLFDDPREPPRVQPKIPLIGHLIGMLQHGVSYYNQTSKKTDSEMYTLKIFHTKLYISNTQRLTPFIQKASKTLSFRPFMQTAAKLIGDATDETYELLGGEILDTFSHAMKNSLLPGPYLDEQNMRMGNRAILDIDTLVQSIEPGGAKEMMLLEWTMHAVIQASSCGVFGENHPFCDATVEEAFWKWQEYLPRHMTKSDFTGKGYAARKIVFDAFQRYCNPIPQDAARVIFERERIMSETGICAEDRAKQHASFGVAVYGNTTPTMYWTIYELFSRPEVLDDLREEVGTHAVTGSQEEGFVLDVAALKTSCPLLLSVYQETQRMRHVHANIRKVMADTLLDGRYLLKEGNYVQMPGNPIHTNAEVWGPTAGVYDPYRFVPRAGSDRKAAPPSSFVAWGAPPHLCPARQFAATEILILAALLAMRVEMKPAGGKAWQRSPAVNTAQMASLLGPTKDVRVEVTRRDEAAGTWSLKMGESMTRISLASG